MIPALDHFIFPSIYIICTINFLKNVDKSYWLIKAADD